MLLVYTILVYLLLLWLVCVPRNASSVRCVLIETDDSLDSINATAAAVVKYVSQKAGIGIGGGSIRAIGSPIRKGDAYHTGIIPFYKHFQVSS